MIIVQSELRNCPPLIHRCAGLSKQSFQKQTIFLLHVKILHLRTFYPPGQTNWGQQALELFQHGNFIFFVNIEIHSRHMTGCEEEEPIVFSILLISFVLLG